MTYVVCSCWYIGRQASFAAAGGGILTPQLVAEVPAHLAAPRNATRPGPSDNPCRGQPPLQGHEPGSTFVRAQAPPQRPAPVLQLQPLRQQQQQQQQRAHGQQGPVVDGARQPLGGASGQAQARLVQQQHQQHRYQQEQRHHCYLYDQQQQQPLTKLQPQEPLHTGRPQGQPQGYSGRQPFLEQQEQPQQFVASERQGPKLAQGLGSLHSGTYMIGDSRRGKSCLPVFAEEPLRVARPFEANVQKLAQPDVLHRSGAAGLPAAARLADEEPYELPTTGRGLAVLRTGAPGPHPHRGGTGASQRLGAQSGLPELGLLSTGTCVPGSSGTETLWLQQLREGAGASLRAGSLSGSGGADSGGGGGGRVPYSQLAGGGMEDGLGLGPGPGLGRLPERALAGTHAAASSPRGTLGLRPTAQPLHQYASDHVREQELVEMITGRQRREAAALPELELVGGGTDQTLRPVSLRLGSKAAGGRVGSVVQQDAASGMYGLGREGAAELVLGGGGGGAIGVLSSGWSGAARGPGGVVYDPNSVWLVGPAAKGGLEQQQQQQPAKRLRLDPLGYDSYM